MENITYVSGNPGKIERMKRKFEDKAISINALVYDVDEPNINDISYISKFKVIEAYKKVNSPCFVADSGFYIEDYPGCPGYPGAFAKRSGISNDTARLLQIMEGIENRNCKFLDCLTFYDGNDFYTFYGESRGTLSTEEQGTLSIEAKSQLHLLFIPEHSTKTLANMTKEEIDSDGHLSATDQFIEWYKTKYLNQNIFKKKMIKN